MSNVDVSLFMNENLLKGKGAFSTFNLFFVLCLAVLFCGCESQKRNSSISTTQPCVKYTLYPGDKLLVRYPTDPSLNQQVPIRSDGMISLPYVGDVPAARRTPQELAKDLNNRYKGILKMGQVTVIVLEESGRRIYLGGQVFTPGAYPLKPNVTLVQALFEAGGVTPEANTRQILILRSAGDEGTFILENNLEKILAGKEDAVALQPFDVVFVPQSVIAKADQFVEQYINLIVPRSLNFPFTYQMRNAPLRVIDESRTNRGALR